MAITWNYTLSMLEETVLLFLVTLSNLTRLPTSWALPWNRVRGHVSSEASKISMKLERSAFNLACS